MCEISVIIPIFNVEDYLTVCLDSIINQSFKNIEIICLNDGSTDNSLNILNEYGKKDSRIKIFTQKNQGLGATRNNALKKASGNYIYFIDSDDYIELDTLEKLHNNAISNDSDIVLFKFKTFDEENDIYKKGDFRIDKIFGDADYSNLIFTYKDVKNHVLNSSYSACLKLYKKEFLDSYSDFTFSEKLFFEDIPFHVKVMLRADKISFVNEYLYNYRINNNSISNSTFNGFDIFKIIDIVEDFLLNNNYFHEFENEFVKFKILQIFAYLIPTNNESYFNQTKNEFKKLKIKDYKTLKKYTMDCYNMVLKSNNFNEYLVNFYKYEFKRVSDENSRLKKLNKDILSSRSWKLTKPLRIFKKLFK